MTRLLIVKVMSGALRIDVTNTSDIFLVGYHGEPKGNLVHNVKGYIGLYYPKKVKGYLLYY